MLKDNQSSTQHFNLTNGKVQVVNLHHTFEPEKKLGFYKHLDSMANDMAGPQIQHTPLAEHVSRVIVTGTQPLPKEFIAIIQNA